MDLSIIIANWNTRQLLLECIGSIYATTKDLAFEVILVDNGSFDGSVEAVAKSFPLVIIIANRSNEGFSKANNAGLRRMRGKYAVLLNSDTILTDGSLATLFAFMETNPPVGVCGPQLLNPDGSKQASVGSFPTFWTEFVSQTFLRLISPGLYRETMKHRADITVPTPIDHFAGACMMVRTRAIDDVGMLDEDYFLYYEEVDWCLRFTKAGWRIYYVPEAKVYHIRSQSVKEFMIESRIESWTSRYLYFCKHHTRSALSFSLLVLTGTLLTAYRLFGYSIVNVLTLWLQPGLRRRWYIFARMLAWHLRGRPPSMGMPRRVSSKSSDRKTVLAPESNNDTVSPRGCPKSRR